MQDIINDSGATVRVQSLTELTPSDPERTISISGARDQVLRGVALVLNTVRAAACSSQSNASNARSRGWLCALDALDAGAVAAATGPGQLHRGIVALRA